MAGLVPIATVLGCNPVSPRSCAVMVRGRSRIRYENTGEKYSPIIISVKQPPQTNQTISTTTQQTIFFIGVEFTGCYNSPPPTEDLVPRSRTIRGGGGREVRDDDFKTTNKELC